MSEVKTIDTKQYIKEGKVSVDGQLWEVKLPGAGTELRMGKVKRRIDLLSKKVDNGTATEEELDRLDNFEDEMFGFFKGIFKDATKDNSEVEKWVEETPTAFIMQAIEDIREQANENDA